MTNIAKLIRPAAGHILDIDPSEVAIDLLNRAHNVNTRKGFPSRIAGRREAYPQFTGLLYGDPYHLMNINLQTFNWWIALSPTNAYAITGASGLSDITAVGQHAIENPSEWSSAILNTIPVFNNGKDPPLYWTGLPADKLTPIPGWPAGTVCNFIAAFRYHLFALNIDGPSGTFENKVMHSDAAEPGALPLSWTPTAANEAGDFSLSDSPGRCICAVPLGQQLLVYKPTSVFSVEYAGQPDQTFSQRTVTRSFGTYGPNCVVDLGNKHLVVGNGDIYLTDGINFQSIAENRIKRSLSNTIAEDYPANIFCVRDLNRRETWVCVPEAGNQFCTIAHVWDERRDTWVTRDLNQARCGTIGYVEDSSPSAAWDADSEVWDTDVSTWNAASVGAISRVVIGEPRKLFVEDTPDLVSITANLQKLDIGFDDDAQNKLITRVLIRGIGLGFTDVRFRLGCRQSPDDLIAWQTYTPALPDGTPVEINGRYISIDIRTTGVNEFTIDRLRFEGRYNGAY